MVAEPYTDFLPPSPLFPRHVDAGADHCYHATAGHPAADPRNFTAAVAAVYTDTHTDVTAGAAVAARTTPQADRSSHQGSREPQSKVDSR